MDAEILSVKNVADILQQDIASVLRLFEDQSLPGRQIGEHWYTTRRQLVEFIEGFTAAPAEAPAPPPAAMRPIIKRTPNSWTCTGCGAKNDPERVMCRVCRAVRDTPLINYRPKH